MLRQKPYTTYLEGKRQDGSLCALELSLTPIGFSSMLPDSFWMRHVYSLGKVLQTTLEAEAQDSLLVYHQLELGF